MIAEATVDDAAAIATLLREIFPERLSTVAGIAHGMRTTPPEARALELKAELDGVVVGVGRAMLDWASAAGDDAFAMVAVGHPHRRRGIGTGLWDRLDRHLTEIGARVVRATGDAAPAGRFPAHRGFRTTSTQSILVLDPAAAELSEPPPSDVEVLPFSAFATDPERVYAVDFATMQDEPGDYDLGGMTLERWLLETYDHPAFDADASSVACVAGEPVGTSLLYADHPSGRALNGGTGVLAAFRGRGLGLALKRRVLAHARDAGITRVFTANDEANAPMLAINRRLGYAPFAERTAWRRG